MWTFILELNAYKTVNLKSAERARIGNCLTFYAEVVRILSFKEDGLRVQMLVPTANVWSITFESDDTKICVQQIPFT
jgi:hypothetical protein